MAPKHIPAGVPLVTGLPFTEPLAPWAVMVTDSLLRMWLPAALLLLAMAGAMAGTAGWTGLAALPFTGETEELLPWLGFWGPPTATGGVALDAIGGDDIFLVALAYVRAVG